MSSQKIHLASDNWSPAHPMILQAVLEANEGSCPAYGLDVWTEKAQHLIQETFKVPCKVFMIPTGTGANVLALKLCCKRFESVICTSIAHIHYQESGSAEAVVGCKLSLVPHINGKLTPEGVSKALKKERAFGRHSTSPRLLSITQPTEVGTVYTLEELRALSEVCQKENLLFHIDGSRLYNAAVHLNVSLDEIQSAAKADILSLGGTKNGLMGAEALLIFNPSLYEGSDHIHKQTLALLSKMRYLSAQYIPFLQKKLWHQLASHANEKAQILASIIEEIPELSLAYPVESNQIFFSAPASWIPLIQEKIPSFLWDAEEYIVRFVTSWYTSEKDINQTRCFLKELATRSQFEAMAL